MLLRSGKHMLEDNPIIVITGPSTPGGTSRVISAYKREFPLDVASLTTISYIQYRGTGVPLLELGEPGDLFIDLSPNAYRVFVRYRSWREWPGIHEETDMSDDSRVGPFTHPRDTTRIVWCTQTDVVWYKITSIRLAKTRLFSADCYRGVTFISTHDLIRRSAIPNEEENEENLLGDVDGPELKRRRREASPASCLRDEPHGLNVNSSSMSGQAVSNGAPSLYNLPTPIDSDDNPDHQSEPDDIQVIIAQDRYFESSASRAIHYTQYRGRGSPPSDLGSPGDMYIDTNPESHRLFARYESWKEWMGVYRVQPPFRFPHPQDKDRQLWVTHSDIVWFRTKSIWSNRTRALSSTTESFISAHTMIQKSGFLDQDLKPSKDNMADDEVIQETQHGGTANCLIEIRKRKPFTSDSNHLGDIVDLHSRQSTSTIRSPHKKARINTLGADDLPPNPYLPPPARATMSPMSPLPDDLLTAEPQSPSIFSVSRLLPPIPTSPNLFNYWDADYTLQQYTEDLYAAAYTPEVPQSPSANELLQDDVFPRNSSPSWPFGEYLQDHQMGPAPNASSTPDHTIDPRTFLPPSFHANEQGANGIASLLSSIHPSSDNDQRPSLSQPLAALLVNSPCHGSVGSPSPTHSHITCDLSLSLSPQLDLRETQHKNRAVPPSSPPINREAPENPTNVGHLDIMFRTRTHEKPGGRAIKYMQYRAYGPPPEGLGSSGDMYFDVSVAVHRLFVRYTNWREWLGIYRTATPVFEHPEDKGLVVWCSRNDVSWYKKFSMAISRARLFEKCNVPFIPAHTLIKRSGVLDDLNWSTATNTVNGHFQVVQPGTNALAPPTGSAIIDVERSPLTRVITPIPPLSHTSSQRPTEMSAASACVPQAENSLVKDESDIIKTTHEVSDTLKTQESLQKRQMRHQLRMIQLTEKEKELTSQEEKMLLDEQRAKEGLERASRCANRLQEHAKQLEDVLVIEGEDILTKETEISQREGALQQRKKLIAEMEGRISEWEHI
ncbi:hypothetical protein BDZ94DRAFT_1322735 [Collybia nuda]|uniref:Uncharacterized protein n=1 Tax=Collybia nuda TaxID=64659 RepID=A0A9P5Y2P4_9AGAR|nr:hypothetical protein BDZ94DRAFT_1322735 [Collybia nuda]